MQNKRKAGSLMGNTDRLGHMIGTFGRIGKGKADGRQSLNTLYEPNAELEVKSGVRETAAGLAVQGLGQKRRRGVS